MRALRNVCHAWPPLGGPRRAVGAGSVRGWRKPVRRARKRLDKIVVPDCRQHGWRRSGSVLTCLRRRRARLSFTPPKGPQARGGPTRPCCGRTRGLVRPGSPAKPNPINLVRGAEPSGLPPTGRKTGRRRKSTTRSLGVPVLRAGKHARRAGGWQNRARRHLFRRGKRRRRLQTTAMVMAEMIAVGRICRRSPSPAPSPRSSRGLHLTGGGGLGRRHRASAMWCCTRPARHGCKNVIRPDDVGKKEFEAAWTNRSPPFARRTLGPDAGSAADPVAEWRRAPRGARRLSQALRMTRGWLHRLPPRSGRHPAITAEKPASKTRGSPDTPPRPPCCASPIPICGERLHDLERSGQPADAAT